MATTAHEVALGVSVESKAAEASLARLSAQVTSLGDTFKQGVLNGLADFKSRISGIAPEVGVLATALRGLNVPLGRLATLAQSANTSLSAISVGGVTSTVSSLNIAVTGLAGSIGSLATASSRLAAPLSTLATSLATVNSSISSLNVAAAGSQLQQFAAAINAIDAKTLSRQIGVITVALDRGATSMAAYPPMVASMARSFQRLAAVDISNVFTQQITGVTGLNSALTTALGPVQRYAMALRTIASASGALASTSSSIGALSAQAAGLQLLSNAITLNITNLQLYATTMSRVASATSLISKSSAGTSSLVASMGSLASAGPTVAAAFGAMTASVVPFAAALRAAATSAQRLYTRLVQLGSVSSSLSTAIGSSRTSMGLFAGILGTAASSIFSQIGLLGRLAASYRSAGTAASSSSSSIGSSSGPISGLTSVVGSLTSKLFAMVAAYAGIEAIKEFGKKVLQTGADFDNAMGMVKAVSRNASDYSVEAFGAMEREAFRMGRTTTYSATKAAEALKELTQGGLTTKQAVQSLGDTLMLAETEAMAVGDAARIVTSMMAQFQASASDLTDFVDKLAKTSAVSKTSIDQLRVAMAYVGTAARSANQPFGEVVAAVGALSTAGVESSQAGTTLRDMLTDLTDTTSYASRKLKALGMDMSLINPRANTLSSIIGTLRARGIDAADAMGIFGVRGGLAAGSLITVYKQYLDVLNAVQTQSKGTASIMQQDVTSNLKKDFDKLTASWDYLVNRIFKSGLGEMMRQVVQQAKDLTIQVADFVDTLKNASQFGDIGEIVSTSLNIGFGTAINYFVGGLVTGMSTAAQFIKGSLKVISNVSFWSGMLDVATAFGNGLSAVIKSAMADFIKGNQEFSTSLIQTIMYAGDLFVHKMKEAAGVMSGIASPSYQKARLAAGDADRRLEGAQSGSAASRVRYAAIFAKMNPSDDNMAELDRASKAYNAFIEPFIKAQDEALKRLEQEGQRVGIVGDYTGSRDAFAAQAKEMAGSAPSDLERSAKEDLAKAKQALPGALTAIEGIFSKEFVGPTIDALSSFKPIEVVSKSSIQASRDRLKTLLKENGPTPASAPSKGTDPVIQGKQSYGVGEIKMDGKGSEFKPNVDSMKELGAGIWMGFDGKAGSTASPLEKATTDNTLALNNLTNVLTNTGGTTANAIPTTKDASTITDAERQTDLASWARTGKIPSRLKSEMDRANGEQRLLEEAVRKKDQTQAKINAEKVQEANISNISSTLGTRLDLGNPVAAALKRGIAVAFDENARPIPQSSLELGAPATGLLQTTSTAGQITTQDLFGVISQIRLGAGVNKGETGRLLTPQEVLPTSIQNMQTIKPLGFDKKQELLNVPVFSPSGPAAGGSLSMTPNVQPNEDRYGAQQVSELSNIKSVLTDINSNIKTRNTADSNKLVITIA